MTTLPFSPRRLCGDAEPHEAHAWQPPIIRALAYCPGVIKLPPVQDLIMENLAARVRLGEPFWTFSNNTKGAARRLEQQGLITIEHAAPGSYRAWMTSRGKELFIDPDYVPPVLRDGQLRPLPQQPYTDR